MSNSTTSNTNTVIRYSIKAAAAKLGLSEVYVRRMIQQGKLVTEKTRVGDTEIWRHEITEETLTAWRKEAGARSTRTDGRNKFTLYATVEELTAIQKFLATSKNNAVIERANKPEDTKRRYAAQKARRAAKKHSQPVATK
jgi:transposase-like protein